MRIFYWKNIADPHRGWKVIQLLVPKMAPRQNIFQALKLRPTQDGYTGTRETLPRIDSDVDTTFSVGGEGVDTMVTELFTF